MPQIFWVDVIFPFFHFHKINIDCILDLTLKCENTHLWNLNRASDCRSATGVRNCTKPPQGIRVDTCSSWYIRFWYTITVTEKSNAWLLHVTTVLNIFKSQMSPQKASRSLMVLSWHPVVLWECFFFWNTQNWWCFGSDFSNNQTRRFFGSEIFKCLLEQQFFYSNFFFQIRGTNKNWRTTSHS